MIFSSLHQFYNSKAWRDFRLKVISDRQDESGIIRCEINGEPIVKTYDMIIHHKIPLTLQNVNDVSISLNPDNVMIVSHKAHNDLHARFGGGGNKKVFYVYGAPCSGKTTFVQRVKGNSDLVVDMDGIWLCITASKRYEKPDALKSNAFGVRDLLLDMVKTRSGNWERAYVIDSGAVKGIRENKIKLLGAEPVFIDTDLETCLKRNECDRDKNKAQIKRWDRYIRDWFRDYTE